MEKEDKELLLKDLCARLPYRLKIYLEDFPNATLVGVVNDGIILHCDKYDCIYDTPWNIGYITPYLFPLSSITKEQQKYITDRWGINENFDFEIDPNWGKYFVDLGDAVDFIEWLNKNHFDYRGLIPKGLAIDATGLNVY